MAITSYRRIAFRKRFVSKRKVIETLFLIKASYATFSSSQIHFSNRKKNKFNVKREWEWLLLPEGIICLILTVGDKINLLRIKKKQIHYRITREGNLLHVPIINHLHANNLSLFQGQVHQIIWFRWLMHCDDFLTDLIYLKNIFEI